MLAVADQISLHHHVLDIASSDDTGKADGTADVSDSRPGSSTAGYSDCCHNGCIGFSVRTSCGKEIFRVHHSRRHVDQLILNQVLDLGRCDYSLPVRDDGTADDRFPDSVHGAVFDICVIVPGTEHVI